MTENNNIDNIHNNLVWKFYGNNKYPISIYRDNSSSVLRDKRHAYIFFDYINGNTDDTDIIRKINNVIQFTENVYINHNFTDKKDILFDNPSMLHQTMNPIMKFYFPGDHDKNYYLNFYFFKLNKDGLLERYDIRSDNDESITYLNSSFAILGEALSLRIYDEISNFYNEYIQIHEPPKKTFLDKIFKKNTKEDNKVNRFDFLNKVNLVNIANELIKSYIYDKNSSDVVNFNTLKDVTLVINIS